MHFLKHGVRYGDLSIPFGQSTAFILSKGIDRLGRRDTLMMVTFLSERLPQNAPAGDFHLLMQTTNSSRNLRL